MTEEAIAAAALEKIDPARRAAFLDEACGDDEGLRRRVEAAIRAREQAGPGETAGSDLPAAATTRSMAQGLHPITEGPGSRIGPYRILQEIGRGGMGAVFMAEQEQPIRRRVALKIIKPGMDSELVTARFEAERQALAMMDHPNIARVLDAGTTGDGRPYFVMELARGVPITAYCDQNRLDPRQRLELFVPVCHAIQHAHLKRLIHRDLKPSNILITLSDPGAPAVPKVIDFGIAKAIDQRLTERTLFTQFGAVIGTPEYMSPEQAEMGGLDIDTRSDLYSLGVLLYELLTGSTPLRRETLRRAALNEMLRRIKEEEPPRPSTRIQTTEELTSIAAQRHIDPAKLAKLVRGELDWIVMKCLEKDRTRRYETASGLARDIERYLADEPVEAGPPSATYKLQKYARKHRVGLAMAASLGGLLIVAATVSTWQAVRATAAEHGAVKADAISRDQRDRALRAEGEARSNLAKAQEQEKKANQAESEAKAVLGFFQDRVVAAGRPEGQDGGLGKDVKLYDAINAAEPSIATDFADQPTVEAAIRDALGASYGYLGEPERAITQHERAKTIREATLGPGHPDTLTSISNLAGAYRDAGRTSDSLSLIEQAVKLANAKLGPDHPDTLSLTNNLAMAYVDVGRTPDAIPLFEQVVELRKAKFGPDEIETVGSTNNLAMAYDEAGRTAEAIALFERALKIFRAKLGPEHPSSVTSMNNLAVMYSGAGRLAEAIPLQEEVVKICNATLGANHPSTLQAMSNLAMSYSYGRRCAEAVPRLEAALRRQRGKLGQDHPQTLLSMNNLGTVYAAAGRSAEAVTVHEEALKLLNTKLGPDHPDTLLTMNNLAQDYLNVKSWTKAESVLRRAMVLREKKTTPDDWRRFLTMSQLGAALVGQNQYAEAEPLLIQRYEGLMTRKATLPAPAQKHLVEARARIAPFYEAWGMPLNAAEWRRRLAEERPQAPAARPQKEARGTGG
jgi:serine/threonine protein kinase/tetratricopeptide (TPR) repeat protein